MTQPYALNLLTEFEGRAVSNGKRKGLWPKRQAGKNDDQRKRG